MGSGSGRAHLGKGETCVPYIVRHTKIFQRKFFIKPVLPLFVQMLGLDGSLVFLVSNYT